MVVTKNNILTFKKKGGAKIKNLTLFLRTHSNFACASLFYKYIKMVRADRLFKSEEERSF